VTRWGGVKYFDRGGQILSKGVKRVVREGENIPPFFLGGEARGRKKKVFYCMELPPKGRRGDVQAGGIMGSKHELGRRIQCSPYRRKK